MENGKPNEMGIPDYASAANAAAMNAALGASPMHPFLMQNYYAGGLGNPSAAAASAAAAAAARPGPQPQLPSAAPAVPGGVPQAMPSMNYFGQMPAMYMPTATMGFPMAAGASGSPQMWMPQQMTAQQMAVQQQQLLAAQQAALASMMYMPMTFGMPPYMGQPAAPTSPQPKATPPLTAAQKAPAPMFPSQASVPPRGVSTPQHMGAPAGQAPPALMSAGVSPSLAPATAAAPIVPLEFNVHAVMPGTVLPSGAAFCPPGVPPTKEYAAAAPRQARRAASPAPAAKAHGAAAPEADADSVVLGAVKHLLEQYPGASVPLAALHAAVATGLSSDGAESISLEVVEMVLARHGSQYTVFHYTDAEVGEHSIKSTSVKAGEKRVALASSDYKKADAALI